MAISSNNNNNTIVALIEALLIFQKYRSKPYPTHCEHDVLQVVGIKREVVSPEDQQRLDQLGFFWSEDWDCWASYRFGGG